MRTDILINTVIGLTGLSFLNMITISRFENGLRIAGEIIIILSTVITLYLRVRTNMKKNKDSEQR